MSYLAAGFLFVDRFRPDLGILQTFLVVFCRGLILCHFVNGKNRTKSSKGHLDPVQDAVTVISLKMMSHGHVLVDQTLRKSSSTHNRVVP